METEYPELLSFLGATEFKSYYVVWKPNLGRIIPIFATMFKSYYVVWKLFLLLLLLLYHLRLNRTM